MIDDNDNLFKLSDMLPEPNKSTENRKRVGACDAGRLRGGLYCRANFVGIELVWDVLGAPSPYP